MEQKYRMALNIIWKVDIIIALIFLYTLFDTQDNTINTEALLTSGFFVFLGAITYSQKCKLEARLKNNI